MNRDEMVCQAKEQAEAYYKTGMNCSECVLKAVLDAGISDLPLQVVALATGFGGGIGLSGNNCGALAGAIMAVGSVHGRKNPHERDEVPERVNQLQGEEGLYRLFNNIPRSFKEKFGAVNCSELVQSYSWQSKERSIFCKEVIGEAAAIAMHWLLVGLEQGYRHPYGENVAGRTD
ncbi:MAG TPA: C-GCAxxG-C-C family protein [Candidatus Limnocylindrales bacterium]|nr:C-GCAxxG-C-C family protein [Candidatus Limnocylindrales bacterium]